ncbi:4891_t:CDS:2, partial [Acaulospora colombiana]
MIGAEKGPSSLGFYTSRAINLGGLLEKIPANTAHESSSLQRAIKARSRQKRLSMWVRLRGEITMNEAIQTTLCLLSPANPTGEHSKHTRNLPLSSSQIPRRGPD